MTLAIGLDVSETRMGWAICTYSEQTPLALGVENLRESGGGWPETQVVRAMRHVKSEVLRLGYEREDVSVVGVEWVYKGPQSLERYAWQAAVIGMAMAVAEILFPDSTGYPLGADEWRAAVGISNAGKREDKKAATLAWTLDVMDLHGFYYHGKDGEGGPVPEDACDALGIATAAALLTEVNERSEAA